MGQCATVEDTIAKTGWTSGWSGVISSVSSVESFLWTYPSYSTGTTWTCLTRLIHGGRTADCHGRCTEEYLLLTSKPAQRLDMFYNPNTGVGARGYELISRFAVPNKSHETRLDCFYFLFLTTNQRIDHHIFTMKDPSAWPFFSPRCLVYCVCKSC
ncbi:hypothetical protein BD289DRAFT_168729 [Coniella lustricola]|uniref:Uncharacterized protein n=1 Tax=Coniella lustricola TaxID=2025994 RepID=A0A2T2ZU07_9PEZI|nr:hypothetical protein BD289DRAFT_168729 [Coniella lustricola]